MAGHLSPAQRHGLLALRPAQGLVLGMAVLALHALVIDRLVQHRALIDPRLKGDDAIEAVFVRSMSLSEPPPVALATAAAGTGAAPANAGAEAPGAGALLASTVAASATPRSNVTPDRPARALPPVEPAASAAAVALTPPEPTGDAATEPPAATANAAASASALPGAESPSATLAAPSDTLTATTPPEDNAERTAAVAAATAGASPSPAATASVAAIGGSKEPRTANATPTGTRPGDPEAFDWPVSTRLSYRLSGWFRGEIHGAAEVRWLREGSRYEVVIDSRIGLPFAPFFTRRMKSEGDIAADGLRPRRYEQVSRLLLQAPATQALEFDASGVLLARGARAALLPGTQDTASQFVQLIYRFRTEAGLLEPGRVIELPLALPHRVGMWRYQVVGLETLDTPFGPLPAHHLRPLGVRPSARELTTEMWFAPQLQYLPVRFLIRQDEETFTDLMIEELPLQAAPAASSPASTASSAARPEGSAREGEAAPGEAAQN